MYWGKNNLFLSLAALAYVFIANAAFAQNLPQRPMAEDGVRGGERISTQAPDGLVYVSQVIDLRDQIGEDEEVYSLDGEPLPRMRTTNVTLGVVIDNQGHIVTRLSNVSPNGPAPEVRVITPQSQLVTARFIGMDAVTGLCVLKSEGALNTKSVRISSLAQIEKLPFQRQVNLLGFHPNQAGGKVNVAALVRPRLHPSIGSINKAEKDFRFSRSNPIYQLTTETPLRAVQDGSFIVETDGSVFGLVSFDTSGDGLHLVYPITRIQRIAEMVIQARQSIPHGWLGATSVNNLAPAGPRSTKGLERGIRVAAVFPDSPADLAGVKPHDVLLSISGRELSTVVDLTNTLKNLPADGEVALKIVRGSEYKVLQAKLIPAPAVEPGRQVFALAERMENMEASASEMAASDPKRHDLESKAVTMRQILSGITNAAPSEVRLRVMYGLEVQPLTTQLAKAFSVPSGVLVSTVAASGKGGQAGLQAGDVVVKVGEQPVADINSLMQALNEATEESIDVLVVRQQAPVKLKLHR